jgi:hypothetical protein
MVIVFFGYLTGIVYKYGILKSISDSYYHLPKNWKILFIFFCWGIVLPAMIIGLEQTGSIFMFLAGAGIGFVGAATAFKEKLTYTVHMTGAIVGIISSQAAIAFEYNLYWLNYLFVGISLSLVILTALKVNVKYFWWIEITAFVCIGIALYSKLSGL